MCASSSRTWGTCWAWPGCERHQRAGPPRLNTVQALWESGLWLDLAVAITALELLVLGCLHAFTRRGLPLHAWALNLVAGLLLMLALKATLAQAAWHWPALCVVLSGLVHSADLWRRWRHDRSGVNPS